VDETGQAILLDAAAAMDVRIVLPSARKPVLDEHLVPYPKTRLLLDGVGYNAKLELPMTATEPYFYFDSDIVWLRAVSNLKPPHAPNAFSTESWSWYNGVANDRLWIQAKTPRRVNSGFYYLGDCFPFERMENMLANGMFDPTRPYNTDQEIMAYLFRDMELYHPDDLKRSRRSIRYDLTNDDSAALHFPGGMWRENLNQIKRLGTQYPSAPATIRYQNPSPLTHAELVRMRLAVSVSDSPLLRGSINRLRQLRGSIRR
jgi:hypothetical protein